MLHKILFSILLLAFVVPAMQMFYPVVEEEPLDGVFIEQELPKLTSESWFSFDFQNKIDTYLDQNFGFRPSFIRLFNQLQYSLFNSSQAVGVVVGKNEYLFEEWYISSYTGSRFVGEEEIRSKVHKLNAIKDTLEKYGTKFIVVLAAGKGEYYPEYIPDFFQKVSMKTNYEFYKKSLEQTDITVFDVNGWFLKMKDTIDYPLFPKTGTHWSDYGAVLAADSLIKIIQNKLQYKIPHFYWNEIELTNNPRNSDDDLEKLTNLCFKIPQPTLAYPLCLIDTSEISRKPNTIVIADSFFWQLYNGPFSWSFDEINYWYYFGSVYPDNYTKKTTTADIDVVEQLKSKDLLILLASTANLYEFGYGFIETVDSIMTVNKVKTLEND